LSIVANRSHPVSGGDAHMECICRFVNHLRRLTREMAVNNSPARRRQNPAIRNGWKNGF
jgi:hypothetical protein